MMVDSRAIEVDGRTVHVAEAGAGQCVVLVHGSLSDYRYWAPQMQFLADKFRVIAPSLRHHYPDRLEGAALATYGVDQHANDLVALLESVCTGPAHLVGHSRGAHVSLLTALQRPDLVASLALADPSVPVENTSASGLTVTRKTALDLIQNGEIESGLEAFIDEVSGSGVWRKLNSRRRQMARDNATTLPAQYADLALRRPLASLAVLTMPILLVGGERSPAPYPMILGELARLLPAARRAVLPRTSHAMNAEDPKGFNQTLLAFYEMISLL